MFANPFPIISEIIIIENQVSYLSEDFWQMVTNKIHQFIIWKIYRIV